jgi:putative transposon-encoded protein
MHGCPGGRFKLQDHRHSQAHVDNPGRGRPRDRIRRKRPTPGGKNYDLWQDVTGILQPSNHDIEGLIVVSNNRDRTNANPRTDRRNAVEEPANNKVKFEIYGEEMIEKRVKLSGNSGRVYLPPNWVGHKVKIIRTD